MVDFSASFKEFLKKYNSTALAKVEDGNTPPDVLNSIYAEYADTFHTWEKLPVVLRDRYDIVPQDIMDAAAMGEIETLKKMENDRTLKTAEDARTKVEEEKMGNSKSVIPEDIIAPIAATAFMAAVAEGYSQQASHGLALESQVRDEIWRKAKGRNLTKEESKLIAESRMRTRNIIAKDWAEHQPEKMLIHMFSHLNRNPDKKDELLPKLADLIQKIETEGRQAELLRILQHPASQAKISRFSKETLDLMNSALLKNVPSELQNGYLANSIPIKMKMAELIDSDNSGKATNIQEMINSLVKEAKDNGIGLDFKNYSARSPHPMSADLRQKLMIACCINDVPYRTSMTEKIQINSDYFRSLPSDVQAVVVSKELNLAKGRILSKERVADAKELYRNMPSLMAAQRNQGR